MENCNKYQERISAFLDGMLPEGERLELMEHLESCADCRTYFDDQLTIHAALAGPEAQAPAGFCEQVMSRVKETKQDKPEKKVIAFPIWRRWAATAACCAIAALGVLGLGGERSETDDMLLQSTVTYSAAVTAADAPAMAEEAPVAAEAVTNTALYAAKSVPTPEAAPAAADAEAPVADTDVAAAGGATLPGATEINPSVMVNGKIYTWVGIVDTGIPDGYLYVSDLTHIEGDVLSEDGQFISTFDAKGQIYAHPDRPDRVYIQITTDWLEGNLVQFSLAE